MQKLESFGHLGPVTVERSDKERPTFCSYENAIHCDWEVLKYVLQYVLQLIKFRLESIIDIVEILLNPPFSGCFQITFCLSLSEECLTNTN